MWPFSRNVNLDRNSGRAAMRKAQAIKNQADAARRSVAELAVLLDEMESLLIAHSEHTGYCGSDLELRHSKAIDYAKTRGIIA